MVKLFKSVVWLFVFAVASTAATAGTITSTGQMLALEGTVAVKKIEIGHDLHLELELGGDYIASDVVTITLKGAQFALNDANWQPKLTFTMAGGAAGSATGKANFMDVVHGDTLRFRMAATATLLEAATLTGVVLDSTHFIDGSTLTASATAISMSNFIGYYDPTPETVLANVTKQFSLSTVTALDAMIDAAHGRKIFLAQPAPDFIKQDRLSLQINDQGAIGAHHFTAHQAVYTVKGKDLSFLMACDETGNKNGVLEDAELQACVVPTLVNDHIYMQVNDKLTELTLVQTANSPSGLDLDLTLAFQAPGLDSDYRIVPQAFRVSVEVAGGPQLVSNAATDLAAGEWRFNGSIVEVAYMPYSPMIEQSIKVTNRSLQNGDIYVIALDEKGNEYDLGVVATAKAQSLTPIAAQVKSALEARGLLMGAATKRFAFEIITDTLNRDVEVFTAYNVDKTGDRLVVNSSNGKSI